MRVAIVGLVHGHVKGFLTALPGNQTATLVAIVEPQDALAKDYAAKYHLDPKLFYTDLETMLVEQHPDAVLVYTTIVDHRKVIEIAARHGVSSMVEKPLQLHSKMRWQFARWPVTLAHLNGLCRCWSTTRRPGMPAIRK